MDKVRDCLERIRVIRGASYGIITKEQLEIIFELERLTDEERENVIKDLGEMGVTPVCEDERHFEFKKSKFSQKEKAEEFVRPSDVEEHAINKEEELAKIIDEISFSLSNQPELLERYKDEEKLFKESLIEYRERFKDSPIRLIIRAAMNVSAHRVRNERRKGWVCGTYMASMRKGYAEKIKYYFTDQELTEFIEVFTRGDILDDRNRSIVLFLLHNVPKTVINRYSHFD